MQLIIEAGETVTPTWINFFSFWIIEIPLAYTMAIRLNIGESGVYYSIIIAEIFMTLTAVWFIRLGKWKLKEV